MTNLASHYLFRWRAGGRSKAQEEFLRLNRGHFDQKRFANWVGDNSQMLIDNGWAKLPGDHPGRPKVREPRKETSLDDLFFENKPVYITLEDNAELLDISVELLQELKRNPDTFPKPFLEKLKSRYGYLKHIFGEARISALEK